MDISSLKKSCNRKSPPSMDLDDLRAVTPRMQPGDFTVFQSFLAGDLWEHCWKNSQSHKPKAVIGCYRWYIVWQWYYNILSKDTL